MEVRDKPGGLWKTYYVIKRFFSCTIIAIRLSTNKQSGLKTVLEYVAFT